eukprot:3725721-Ditylum_brightwellii.AAC.1
MSSWVWLDACDVTITLKKELRPRIPPRNLQAEAWPTLLPKSIRVVLPVSKHGWERVHTMHIAVYGKKNRTV